MDNQHQHQHQHQQQQLSNGSWVMPNTLSSPPSLPASVYTSLPMDMQQEQLSYGTETTMMTPVTGDNGLYQQYYYDPSSSTTASSSMLLTPGVVASEEDYFKPPADINMMREQCSNRMPIVWNGTGMGHDHQIMGMIGSGSNGCYSDDSFVSQRTFCLLSSPFAYNGSSATPPYNPSCIVTKKQCQYQVPYNNSVDECIQPSPIAVSSGGNIVCDNNTNMTSLVTAAPAPTPANSMMHSMTLATSTCISPSHTDAEMMSTTTTTTIPQATARPVVTPSATIAGPASALPGLTLHNHSNSATKDALQFRVILKAPTAATQISDGSPTTYLNRGQSYSIHLQDMYDTDQLITSTFIIMFHEPSHRKVALNYWKFWLGQQKEPSTARVMSLDEHQSMGIHNVRYPGFDRITFDWTGSAKLNIRFNCLSTDFSRIKGVKGIPLRAQMETRVASAEEGGGDMYVEQSYCKIKLFRDKGAERKNKDDAKQIGRHMERVYGVDDAQQQQPIWNTYHQPKPYSEFIRLSALEDNDNTIQVEDAPLIDAQKRTTRKRSYSQHDSTIAAPSTHSNNNNKTDISLYIHVKTTQHQQFHQGAPSKHHVILSEATVDELLAQLCPVLSLHYSQVSEVLWRHHRPSKDHSSNQSNKVSFPRRNSGNDGIGSHFSAALSVDDDVVAKDFVHGTVLTVEWVIKADGTVRLWLQ